MIGRLIEPVDLAKAVDLYQKAASVFEVSDCKMFEEENITDFFCFSDLWSKCFI